MVFVPFALGYTVFVYHTFRGKLKPERDTTEGSRPRLDPSEVACRRDPGAHPSQDDTGCQKHADIVEWRSLQGEVTAINLGQGRNRPTENDHRDLDNGPGQQGAGKPVQHSRIEKRPADKRIRSAHELGHFDLGAAVEDLEADGVADHGEHTGAEQHRGNGQEIAQHIENCVDRMTQSVSTCTRSTSGHAVK